MTHLEPSETHLSITLSISSLDMFSSGSILLSLVMVLDLPLKNAVLWMLTRFPVFESIVSFSNVSSSVFNEFEFFHGF